MNPVLLKPGSDQRSHVVVLGQPAGEVSSRDFVDGRRHLATAAYDAFDDLASRFDVVVAEGAGSPTEINLRASDYVNMGLAQHGGLADRAGRRHRPGRGLRVALRQRRAARAGRTSGWWPGSWSTGSAATSPCWGRALTELEQLTGRRVYGVLPFSSDVWLDSEDTLDVGDRRVTDGPAPLRVAVVRLAADQQLHRHRRARSGAGRRRRLRLRRPIARRRRPDRAARAPGRPSPTSTWLRARGLDRAVLAHAAAGRPVLGICGGFQMLGRTVRDPDGVEGPAGASSDGLGLLDVETVFGAEKVLRLPRGTALGAAVGGYEIHHGRVTVGVGRGLPRRRPRRATSSAPCGTAASSTTTSAAALLAEVARLTGHGWTPSGVELRGRPRAPPRPARRPRRAPPRRRRAARPRAVRCAGRRCAVLPPGDRR